jgi:hypothetical protein
MNSQQQTIVIGVVTSEKFQGETLNDPIFSWTQGSIGYCANGRLIMDGQEIERSKALNEGDTVGILLDMNYQRISFYLNGIEVYSRGGTKDTCFKYRSLFAAITLAPFTDEVEVYLRQPPSKDIRTHQP